jgi:hypothetical protein
MAIIYCDFLVCFELAFQNFYFDFKSEKQQKSPPHKW